jgi:hypothetical protein
VKEGVIKRERKYFVAKHDIASFLAWPGVLWRTGEPEFPRGLKKMHVGDQWVEFAYINDENARDRTQQIVGFYECTSLPKKRVKIPARPRSLFPASKWAWAIKGRAIGWQPDFPVTVPSINQILGKVKFGRQTLTPVSKDEFRSIRRMVQDLKLDPKRIPLLNRDPRNEQEVVAILLAAHEQLGIEKVDRIRSRFPDLRVKIAGKRGLVHLEVETYSSSFILHRHHKQVRGASLKADDESEKLSVAVVCWHDDDKKKEVAAYVHKVFGLRGLLQARGKIEWGR